MTKSKRELWGSVLLALGAAVVPVAAVAQDHVTVVVSDEPKSLDPCDTDLSNNARVLRNNVTESLVNLDPMTGEAVPSLASAWTRVDDLTWEFTLRTGVTFHDGTPFDAAAVAAALTRAQDPALGCEVLASDLAGVVFTPEVVSPTVLRIGTDVPEPILPNKMASVDIGAPSTPTDAKTRAPIGTGPYRLVSWNAGQSVELEAVEGYWGALDVIPQATFVWRAESAVRAAMVDTGEAQIAFEIAPQDATTENDVSYPNAETSLLRIDQAIPPLDDRRVREAINLAIDRDAMIGTIFAADAQKAMQVVLPSVLGYNPEIAQWAYDPDQARQLLDEARADGVSVDTPITLYGRIGIYPNSSESMEAVQAMLLDAGLTVELQMMETGPWLERLLKPFAEDRSPSLLQTQIDNTQGDAVFTLPSRFTSVGNTSTIADPDLDRLIAEASTLTGEERRSAFQEAMALISTGEVNIVPLFHMVAYARVSPDVTYVPDVQAGNEVKLRDVSFR